MHFTCISLCRLRSRGIRFLENHMLIFRQYRFRRLEPGAPAEHGGKSLSPPAKAAGCHLVAFEYEADIELIFDTGDEPDKREKRLEHLSAGEEANKISVSHGTEI